MPQLTIRCHAAALNLRDDRLPLAQCLPDLDEVAICEVGTGRTAWQKLKIACELSKRDRASFTTAHLADARHYKELGLCAFGLAPQI